MRYPPKRAFRAAADTSRKVAHNCPSSPATSGASSAASGCERYSADGDLERLTNNRPPAGRGTTPGLINSLFNFYG
ncbi:hypothetical protein Sliba_24660 [Streptomyces nigrescens]|uniref:Uncharacterized protein n=1 Tax=Streptomyces nigrescens TaxID=1920 RepID=A0A640TE17_STRNI|nr:hypothetical protein Sliba_24660 [Streptomyces libani subsp. libani]GGV89801.1 hypothetical protein GCM10010500_15490 [Streptomyces libani subsp. libani]